MQDARVRWALVGVCLIAFITSGVALWSKQRVAPPPIIIRDPVPGAASSAPAADFPRLGKMIGGSPAPDAAPPTRADHSPAPSSLPGKLAAPSRKDLLYVHVAGAVRHPSLYALPPGSRVMQAVKAAGGPAARADLDAVNLAEKVTDGEKVYIPRESRVTPPPMAPPGNTVGYAPAPPSDGARGKATTGTSGAAGGKPGKLLSPAQGKVNLNTADAEELQRLPGVGPAMAARILAYRQQAGRFERPDDLLEVGGIGPKKFARIAPLVKAP